MTYKIAFSALGCGSKDPHLQLANCGFSTTNPH